ncbi:hypothetical protein GCM10009647_084900 [Streptomyces sanglieri]
MDEEQFDGDVNVRKSASSIYHVLRAFRRRITILLIGQRALVPGKILRPPSEPNQSQEAESIITVKELTKEIVAVEEGIPRSHATGTPYHNVYTSLTQTHLPRLDDIGAITYDEDRKKIYADHNLLVLTTIVLTSEPLIKTYFDVDNAEQFFGGPVDTSITD